MSSIQNDLTPFFLVVVVVDEGREEESSSGISSLTIWQLFLGQFYPFLCYLYLVNQEKKKSY